MSVPEHGDDAPKIGDSKRDLADRKARKEQRKEKERERRAEDKRPHSSTAGNYTQNLLKQIADNTKRQNQLLEGLIAALAAQEEATNEFFEQIMQDPKTKKQKVLERTQDTAKGMAQRIREQNGG